MLNYDFLKVNNVKVMIPPKNFSYTLTPVETVKQSEAGTDLALVTRLNKHKFELSWEGVDASFSDTVEGWCTQASVTLTYRSTTYTVRARNFQRTLPFGAYDYPYSDGLWNISLNMVEV